MRKYLLLNGYARRNSHRIGYPTINKYRSDCVAAVDKKRSISTRLSPSLNHDNAVGGQLGRYAMWMSSLTLALMAPAVETMCENTASTFYEMNQKNKDVKEEEEEAYAEEYNEEDERSCPFCRFFLDSPCKETFIKWQQCVKVRARFDVFYEIIDNCICSIYIYKHIVQLPDLRNQTKQQIVWIVFIH